MDTILTPANGPGKFNAKGIGESGMPHSSQLRIGSHELKTSELRRFRHARARSISP
jgi:hypothetical protein